jgi:hypothetical protein
VLTAIVLAGGVGLGANEARADGCAGLGGIIAGGECQVSGSHTVSNAYTLDETLRLMPGATLTVPAALNGGSLSIVACVGSGIGCDIILEPGSRISGDVTGTGTQTGVGATINLNASRTITLASTASITSVQNAGSCTGGRGGSVNLLAAADITLAAGSIISVNAKCPAGTISLNSSQGNVVTNGSLLSESTNSGTGANQAPGGGTITVIARCDLAVGGVVSSKGGDPGADLVHLEGGCTVTITGLVQSTGSGHAPPNSPTNHCSSPTRPDKPVNSVACIEVWAGNALTIANTAELNADTGSGGGNGGTSWIDLFSRGPIAVNGDAGLPFSVHANGVGGSGGTGEAGGTVTAKSVAAALTAIGHAFQASGTSAANSKGGTIVGEAAGNVTLDTAGIEATAGGAGGSIASRAFQGALSWQSGKGDVRPNATGTIALTTCLGAIPTTGTNFNGEVPSTATNCAATAPTLPAYVTLPTCICSGPLPPDVLCPQNPTRLLTRTVDAAGPRGNVPNSTTLQDAVDKASSSEVIGVFANTDENVTIPTKRLTITQCTVARVTALDVTKPVIDVSSPDPISIIGLDAVGGTVGFKVQTSLHVLKGLRVTGASDVGVLVEGNDNKVAWNRLTQNRVGLRVTGSRNNLSGGTIDLSTGDGAQISGPGDHNVLMGSTIKQNQGNGVTVDGSFNKIKDNSRVDNNGLSGFVVTGTGNVIRSNAAGSGSREGNGADGFRITGPGTTLDSNKASSNRGNGFSIAGGGAGTANIVKGNLSNRDGENGAAEFLLSGAVSSQGGNKADGKNVPTLNSNPAKRKCALFPAQGQTATFAMPYVCQ